jgi:hypothetical protein
MRGFCTRVSYTNNITPLCAAAATYILQQLYLIVQAVGMAVAYRYVLNLVHPGWRGRNMSDFFLKTGCPY